MPDLEPETKEVWAGLRELTSTTSTLRDEIDTLRAQLSGFDAYQSFLKSQASYSDLETNLTTRYDSIAGVSGSDVTETVSFLTDTIADFATYAGDGSVGALSLSGFDAYRTFLLDNGASSVGADRHIQLLKEGFGPDAAVAADAAAHDDWGAFEDELEANGVSASSAGTTVDRLRDAFASVGALDRTVLGADTWTDVESALQDRGLSSGAAADIVDDLQAAYGDPLSETAKDQFSEFDSFAQFEEYLIDKGFDSDKASTFVKKVTNQYQNFNQFRKQVISKQQAITKLINQSQTQPSTGGSGGANAGVKVYQQSGTTDDGVPIPAGGVEVRGTEVHFSQVGAPPPQQSQPSGSLSYSAITLTPAKPNLNPSESVTIASDVTNSSSTAIPLAATLVVDGSVLDRKPLSPIPANSTRTVSFTVTGNDLGGLGEYDVGIGDSGTTTIRVVPKGIQP